VHERWHEEVRVDVYEDVIIELDEAECWAALRADEFGRLAYRLGDEVNLVPLNYAVDGGALFFRTAEGSKLLGIVMHPDVVFEIDTYGEDSAESVIVRGRARLLEEDEARRADTTRLRSWLPTLKYNIVEIVPVEVTGRRLTLSRAGPDEGTGG
jgi:nitroimidazol reductase NimA-like FMN-containing flavoprotein (pyridoxamine 5'-phosphate oxidase superfamily)